jgi:large subunit ribosomal protein L22
MQITAKQKYIRISPRKLRLVVKAIRELEPQEALDQLSFIRKAAAYEVAKTIKQALANAVNNANIEKNSLKFKSIQIKEGATYKRWRPVSRGRAHPILKRTSHIQVVLESDETEKKDIKKKKVKKQK